MCLCAFWSVVDVFVCVQLVTDSPSFNDGRRKVVREWKKNTFEMPSDAETSKRRKWETPRLISSWKSFWLFFKKKNKRTNVTLYRSHHLGFGHAKRQSNLEFGLLFGEFPFNRNIEHTEWLKIERRKWKKKNVSKWCPAVPDFLTTHRSINLNTKFRRVSCICKGHRANETFKQNSVNRMPRHDRMTQKCSNVWAPCMAWN